MDLTRSFLVPIGPLFDLVSELPRDKGNLESTYTLMHRHAMAPRIGPVCAYCRVCGSRLGQPSMQVPLLVCRNCDFPMVFTLRSHERMKIALALAVSLCDFLAASNLRAATYYVARTGSDAAAGTAQQPFLTVQKGVNMAQPGDTVFVASGTYQENVRTSSRGGTAGLPITLDGLGVATIWSIALENPHINFQNFTVQGGTNLWQSIGYLSRTANNCVVSNNVFDAGYCLVLYNVFNFDSPTTGPYGAAASGCLVISNIFEHGYSCPVLTIYGATNVVTGNRFIDSDTVDWLRPFGLSNYITGNVFSNDFTSGASGNHPDCFQTFGTGVSGAQWITISGNLFIKGDEDTQICMTSADDNPNVSDWLIYNNKFIGISAKGTIAVRNFRWYNNLFYQCSTNSITAGPVLIFTTTTNATYKDFASDCGHGGQVFNNVFLDCGDSRTNNNSGWYSISTYLTNVAADYNYVGKLGYQPVAVDSQHRPVGNPGGWDVWSWWETHGLNGGTPNFLSEANGNFSVRTNSILFAAGINFSSIFTKDVSGATRPPSGAWTIGPYEAARSLATRLAPPTNLHTVPLSP